MSDERPDEAVGRVVARTGAAAGLRGGLKICVPGADPAVIQSADDEDYVFPAGWVTASVKASSKAGARVFVIEPDPGGDEWIEYAGWYVRGAFRVVRKITGARAVEAAWAAAKKGLPPAT